jgi:hypothetical protein
MTAQPKMILSAGGAELVIDFVAKAAEPAKDCAELKWRGTALVEALFNDILQPFLAEWARAPGDRRAQIQSSVDAAMDGCVEAFRACAPEKAVHEQRTVMAALAIIANLQRTLILLGESLAQPKPKQRGARRAVVKLSRAWCGLVPRRRRPPGPGILPFHSLVRALSCSPGEIDARCREALATLRKDFESGRFVVREDLRQRAREWSA